VKHLDIDSSDDEEEPGTHGHGLLEELTYPAEAKDVFKLSKVKSIWNKLHDITPLEASQQWPSKAARKNRVKKVPRYGTC